MFEKEAGRPPRTRHGLDMPYSHSIKDHYLHIQWHGELCNEDLRSIGAELPGISARLGYAPNVLHTFDDVTGGKIEPWSIFQHSLRREDTRLPNKAKSAAVAKTAKVHAITRLFMELNRNPNIVMAVFDSEEAAIKWLSIPSAGEHRRDERHAG